MLLKLSPKTTFFDKLIILNMSLVSLTILLTILDSSLVSNIFYLTFFVLLLSALKKNFILKKNILALAISMTIIAAFCVLMSTMNSYADLSFNYLINYFAFIFLLLYMLLMSSYKPSVHVGKCILIIGLITACIYPFAFYILHIGTEDVLGTLTMNFTNPNLLAMFLYQSILYCFTSTFIFEKKIIKLFAIIIALLDFSIILIADSRNCVLSLTMVVIASIYMVIKKRHTIPNWIIKIVAVFPFLFMWFYLKYINLFHFEDDTMMSHDGKSVMSRVGIWNHALDNLNGVNLFIGNYPILNGNAHNSHLSILGSFGLIVAILFVIFLYVVMKVNSDKIYSYKQAICLIGFFGTLFLGMAEGALVCGTLGIYIPACTFICLAGINWNNTNLKR